MISPPTARSANGPLVLADIGGYSSFLGAVATAHADDAFADGKIPDAYALVSSLLDGIVSRLVPPLTLSKLEGDAVFAYAADYGDVPLGPAFRSCIDACYAEFQRRLATAHDVWACRCDACSRIDQLDLKFIVHAGPYVIQDIAGKTELAGPNVVIAHRLLKNEAAQAVGNRAYLLVTATAADRLGLRASEAIRLLAEYAPYPAIEVVVYPLVA
jgi:hypothetical protein